ncbi:MAG: 6-hydroxymethylpterin diphosphokinase MptE-like protein [Thermodesulfobacteriota bacterium]
MINIRIKKIICKYRSRYDSVRFKLAKRGLPLGRNEKQLLSLKNAYFGRRVFIIANGPSLKLINLQLLKGELTIGCNGIFLLFKDMGFLPTFYTVEDTLVAEDRCATINSIRETTKIIPNDLRYCIKPDADTIYINFIRLYTGFPKFTDRFESHVYWGGTVTFLNMQLAYYLGSREVYLIGADHNYQKPAEKDQIDKFVITSHSPDLNHFHPDYFGPGFRYHDPMVDRMEKAYVKAKDFFDKNGGAIYNATVGGNLEVFKRIAFDSLF